MLVFRTIQCEHQATRFYHAKKSLRNDVDESHHDYEEYASGRKSSRPLHTEGAPATPPHEGPRHQSTASPQESRARHGQPAAEARGSKRKCSARGELDLRPLSVSAPHRMNAASTPSTCVCTAQDGLSNSIDVEDFPERTKFAPGTMEMQCAASRKERRPSRKVDATHFTRARPRELPLQA